MKWELNRLWAGQWVATVDEITPGGSWAYLVTRWRGTECLQLARGRRKTREKAQRAAENELIRDMILDPSLTIGNLVRRWLELFPDCIGLRSDGGLHIQELTLGELFELYSLPTAATLMFPQPESKQEE